MAEKKVENFTNKCQKSHVRCLNLRLRPRKSSRMLTMTFDDIIYATLDLLSVHMYIDWKVGRCASHSDNTKIDNQLCKRDPFSELNLL